MRHYTAIPKDIIKITGNNKLETVHVCSYIKSRETYKTHSLDNLTYLEIAHHLNIPLPTVKNIVPTLFDNRFLFTYVEHSDIGGKTYLTYHFHHSYENFFYIDNSFFKDENYATIEKKYRNQVKGLILLIKCICINGTNNYLFQRKSKNGINYAELSRLLNTDRDTLEKYMKLAIDSGLITIIKGGISITDPNIYPYYLGSDYFTEYYNMICGWCLHYKISPPERNDSFMGLLIARYPILPRAIIMLAKKDKKEPKEYIKMMKANTDKYHILKSFLPYQLTTRRVKPKDGYLSWEYLCKVLNITIKDKPQKHELKM